MTCNGFVKLYLLKIFLKDMILMGTLLNYIFNANYTINLNHK